MKKKVIILGVAFAVTLGCIGFFVAPQFTKTEITDETEIKNEKEPTKNDLMICAQTVVLEKYPDSSLTSISEDYKIYKKKDLVYEIHSKMMQDEKEKAFTIVLQFADDSYEKYEVESFQIEGKEEK